MNDPSLLVHYIWTPVLEGDGRDAASAAALRLANPRARHWWDAGGEIAHHMADILKITRDASPTPLRWAIAWDVYLAYGRGRVALGDPDFWMHQLAVTHAPRLNPAEFRRQVERLLYP